MFVWPLLLFHLVSWRNINVHLPSFPPLWVGDVQAARLLCMSCFADIPPSSESLMLKCFRRRRQQLGSGYEVLNKNKLFGSHERYNPGSKLNRLDGRPHPSGSRTFYQWACYRHGEKSVKKDGLKPMLNMVYSEVYHPCLCIFVWSCIRFPLRAWYIWPPTTALPHCWWRSAGKDGQLQLQSGRLEERLRGFGR